MEARSMNLAWIEAILRLHIAALRYVGVFAYFAGSIVIGIVTSKLIEIPSLRLRERLFPQAESACCSRLFRRSIAEYTRRQNPVGRRKPMRNGHGTFAAALIACLLMSGIADAKSRRKKGTTSSVFSYYMLVLSDAPDFCDQPQGQK